MMVLMEKEADRKKERTERWDLPCLNHRLPSMSAIPSASYLLMSSLSRIDLLHHHHYHLVDEH